jgi:hypothetical protein
LMKISANLSASPIQERIMQFVSCVHPWMYDLLL